MVSTFPRSDFYDLGTLLTSMGIGEAAVTILSETGVPTPVVHTRIVGPQPRMAPADDVEGVAVAPLFAQYGTRVDAQSAREILAAAVGASLKPRQGKRLQSQVMRGVFGMLRKKL